MRLRATGHEPSWFVEIAGGRATILLHYGAERAEFAAPEPEREGHATIFRFPARGMILTLAEGPCTDSMSGMPHPSRAMLETPLGTYPGCAGDPLALLEGREWVVESVGGERVDDVRATIAFLPDGRVAGTSGCNRFAGGFLLTGESLRFTSLAGTRMACPEPEMRIEQRLLDALAAVDLFAVADDGTLHLTAGGETVITARRPRPVPEGERKRAP